MCYKVDNEKIDVTVIIPTKNLNDPSLLECVSSVKNQFFEGKIEIITVAGGTIAQARNEGIQRAHGEMIAFIDSDCIAPKYWLKTLRKYLISNKSVAGVGGYNISPPDSSLLSKAIDNIFSSYFGSLGSASLYEPKKIVSVNSLACINSIYWRKILIDAGGFDERFILNEDTNLGTRVKARGYDLYFIPDCFVWHLRKDSFYRFSKQFFSYGVSRMRSILTSKNYAEKKFILPFFLVLLFPLITYLSLTIGWFITVLYLTLIFYIGLKNAIKEKTVHFLFLIPPLFIIQHFSYFFGMLFGLVKGKWEKLEKTPIPISVESSNV